MSKSHDFKALHDAVWRAKVSDFDGPPRSPETIWCQNYAGAIETALVRHDYEPLRALLAEGRPVHPMLLPALADALMARGRSMPAGRKPKLTTIAGREVARRVQYLRRIGYSDEDAKAEAALAFGGLSESTVKRAYEREVPQWLRPVHKRRR